MYSPLPLVVITFLFSLLFTPLVRQLAIRFGLVDRPDLHRKLHSVPIPRIGGLAILLSLCSARLVLYLLSPSQSQSFWHGSVAFQLVPATALIFGIGIVDDVVGLTAAQKLIGQVSASLVVYLCGIQIHGAGAATAPHWWSLPATVGWLVFCTNAMNLIDGIDGLATGIGLLATLTIGIAAAIRGDQPLVLAAAPMVGALLGFLRYNFTPATIFLGDCGSLLIGFLLGSYGILLANACPTPLSMAAPLIILSIPIGDTSLAILRRFLRNQPIFRPDRGHIHHRLRDRGLTVRDTALVLYACCVLSAFLSLLIVSYRYELVVLAVFAILFVIAVNHIGYEEIEVARRMLFSGTFPQLLNSHVSLEEFACTLAVAHTPEECWALIKTNYQTFGFSYVQMHLAGKSYWEPSVPGVRSGSWKVEIPLSDEDYIRLEGGRSTRESIIPLLAKVLQDTLAAKLSDFAEAR